MGAEGFLASVEAADNETIAQPSADLASRGAVKIITYPGVEVSRLIDQMKTPHKLGHN